MLRSLREDAESFVGEPINEAVITVPAYFNDRQRRAIPRAVELAGLKVDHLLRCVVLPCHSPLLPSVK